MTDEDISKSLDVVYTRLNIQGILIEVLYDIIRTDLDYTQDEINEMVKNRSMITYGGNSSLN